jgi:hypothetical protein
MFVQRYVDFTNGSEGQGIGVDIYAEHFPEEVCAELALRGNYGSDSSCRARCDAIQ